MSLRIANLLNVFAVILLCGFIVATGSAVFSLMHLRVGGPVFIKQSEANELIADILPPPLYVVEAFLTAHMGPDHIDSYAMTADRLHSLEKDYRTRRERWRNADIPENIKSLLLNDSDVQVQKFWTVINTEYLPALQRKDLAAVEAAVPHLETPYFAHRAVIDKINTLSADYAASQVKAADQATVVVFVLLGVTSLAMLAVVLVGVGVLRVKVVNPLVRMKSYMGSLAGGDYDQDVPYGERPDEIGEMAQSVSVFRSAVLERRAARLNHEQDEKALQARRDAEAQELAIAAAERQRVVDALDSALLKLASGDLRQRINHAFPAEYERLRGNFNATLETLESTIGSVVASASAVGGGAHEISAAADDLSRRTEQQAASLEETAAALDQVTTTIRHTAKGAEEARQVMDQSRKSVEDSGHVAKQAVEAMERIDSSSSRITHIIGVIDEIAFQTNLLALNAGVEAARAGDAGRGFAVVAQEVRALAQRSADAAKEIKTLIADASDSVQSGVALVGKVGAELGAIVTHFGRIETLVRDIAQAAKEQATGLSEVNSAVNQMDQVTQQNAAMVEQTTAASHSLSREAQQLAQLVARFEVSHGSALRQAA